MEKHLNIAKLEEASEIHGVNQSDIAKSLGVTRAAVSKWFKGKSFPRPAELLKLGRLLELRHKELVQTLTPQKQPLVAFRKRGSCKTTDAHQERAQNMGRFLHPLVEYLDVDEFIGPPSLKNPSCDYRYLQELAARIRRELDIGEKAPFEFTDLIKLFHDYQAIIVPTLWGHKSKHENALHIHLPESQTTWIYLNLDVEIHDFKFWMAHELGHILTVDLLREGQLDEAEDFADAFAGALLFPEPLAKRALADYQKKKTEQGRLKVLGEWAEKQTISPFSVWLEIEKFAKFTGEQVTEIEVRVLHSFRSIFSQRYMTLSEVLFDGGKPTADHFMRIAQEKFDSEIYSALGKYVKDRDPGPGVIATILGVPPWTLRLILKLSQDKREHNGGSMAQTKIIVDSNSYFRLAQNIHPLLCQPFGDCDYTLYIHADLNAEFKFSSRLRNKFHWVSEPRYIANRGRSVSISKKQKKAIEETYDYLWEHVLDEFLRPHGKGPSQIDTLIVATALVLEIRVVTDDRDMIELAKTFEVHQITSLEMMKLMLDEEHIDDEKVDQVVEQWIYDNDTPNRDWKSEFEEVFGRKPPEGG